MARKIDESKPLSSSDRKWLQDMGRTADIDRIDAANGREEAEATEEEANATLRNDLIGVLTKHGVDPGDDPVAAVDAALGAADSEDEEAPPFGPTDDDGQPNEYDDWTADQLRDELGKRELSKSGNKAELIERLEEDD